MKHFKLKEIGDTENFDLSVLAADIPFTQADFYGEWQNSLGRTVKRFFIYRDKEVIAYFQLIVYPLPFGKKCLYTPYGPVTKDFSKDFFSFLKEELTKIATAENAIFVRLDFTPSISKEILSDFFTEADFSTYNSAYFQPRAEWYLGLKKAEDELLAAMHEKTRYSIRLSERKGIVTEIVTKDFEKYFDTFYELMAATAKRNGFSLHPQSYYKNIFQNLSKIENAYLTIARYEKKILAINLIVVFSGIANYVFGGSSSEERNRMPTYLAHWEAIRHAKQIGCTYYNFGGIATEDNEHKSWDGLTLFKKKFGGKEIRHCDFFDIVVRPNWYRLYTFRKRLKN